MQFNLLGPLDVTHCGENVDIGGPRQQTVLAMLLLAANHVMAIDRLIEAVWDEKPPHTARAQIQICISALRKQLEAAEGRQRIVSRRPGYMIVLEDGNLDLDAFDAHIAAAREAAQSNDFTSARAEYQSGVGLWRGRALDDIPSRLVQQSVTKLQERQLTAVEECVDCELRLGLHDQIGDLVGWVKEYPLRERFRVLLITALYQAGRQAEALEAYQNVRGTLMDELAIEPCKELQDLQQAILAGAPVNLVPQFPAKQDQPKVVIVSESPPVPRLLPATIPDFTGRSVEVSFLVDRISEGGTEGEENQAVPVNIILGRGGIGKTKLAVHVAHKIAPQFPDGQLFAKLRNGDYQINPSNILERFLRALGIPSTAIPVDIEERAETYRNLLAERRVLVVLDDAMSEQQVDALLPGSSGCSVIVTSQRRLTGLAAASRLELHGFSQRSAIALLTSVVGPVRTAAEPAAMAELCRLCEYLPVAVRIVAARLAARPHWSAAHLVDRLQDGSRRIDELSHGGTGVRASISLTYEALSPDARRLFRMLAVANALSFASWVGSPLLQIDTPSAENLLEELTEAYLIDAELDSVTGVTRYSFHEIMRSFARDRLVAEETPQDRHQALERLIGALLFLAEEANRHEYAGDFMLPSSGASRWPLPEPLVRRLMDDPLTWFEAERPALVSAVLQAAAAGLVEHAWDIALCAVTVFESHSHFDDWHITHETALKAACRAGDHLGEAAMRYSLGSLYMFERQADEAITQLTRAHALFKQLGNQHGIAHALRNLAYLNRMNGDLELALTRWEETLGTFEALGDQIAEAHVLQNMAQVHLDFGDHEKARDCLVRAENICTKFGNRRVGAQVLYRLGELHLRCGEFDLAADAYQQVISAVQDTHDETGECHALLGLAMIHLRSGRWQVAGTTLTMAMRLAVSIHEPMMQSRIALARSEVALEEGLLDEAAADCDQAVEGFQDLKAAILRAEALLMRGRIHAAAGRPEPALSAWRDSAALLSALDLPAGAGISQELEREISALSSGGTQTSPQDRRQSRALSSRLPQIPAQNGPAGQLSSKRK